MGALNWEAGQSLTLALNSHLDKPPPHSKTPIPSLCSRQRLDWPSQPVIGWGSLRGPLPWWWDALIPCPICGREHQGRVEGLAAETAGVRILRRESRSVDHPRSVLHGVESPCLLTQPERTTESPGKGMASQAWQGTESIVWYHRHSIRDAAKHHGHSIGGATKHHGHSIGGAAKHHGHSIRGAAKHHGHIPAISSFPENTSRHLSGEKHVKRGYSTFCWGYFIIFSI